MEFFLGLSGAQFVKIGQNTHYLYSARTIVRVAVNMSKCVYVCMYGVWNLKDHYWSRQCKAGLSLVDMIKAAHTSLS